MADEENKSLAQSILDFDFKAAREQREALAKAKREEDLKVFLAGPTLESTIKCMRYGCIEMGWVVPSMSSVLCREHTMEVLRGEAKAPPLRRNIDHYTPSRRILLVEDYGGDDPKSSDKP